HKINQTNLKLKEKNLPKLKVGISLHKGKVVVGSIGGLNRKQHTIIGDPVNMASRLEALCKDFQVGVVASSIVIECLSNQYKLKFVSLGTQKIRGFDNPIEVYGALPIERKLVSVA
ncbi:MAG: adenylate/guanylate cyclase domain-containing protein, partial [Bdellovibrionaceae bacterium]|nr:adenylate/guanylate cyclase domain-containing protein [Pseudobdellovibrionaceae bacterium]